MVGIGPWILATLAACTAVEPTPSLGGPADTVVVSADPELRRMAGDLLPALAERSGLELRAPVRVERRSRAQLETYIIGKLEEELPPARAAAISETYELLGLVPAGFDLRTTLRDVYTEQVAGFYDPDSTTLYVLDDQPPAALESLLMHELVHAVQDQWLDLAGATAPELGNDRRAAAQAAIEGHAMLVMLEHSMAVSAGVSAGSSIDVLEFPMFAGTMRPALEGIRDEYPALGGAPRIVQESLLLPYLEGAAFVQSVWLSENRRVPLGEMLPASTEQVSRPDRFTSTPPDAPTEVRLVVDADARIVLDDVLGFAETRVFLEELAGESAGIAASGWDGDRWALIEDGGARGVVWALVFDTEASRDRFISTLTPHLADLPRRATLGAMPIDGRPVAMLRVGVQPDVEVTLEGGSDEADPPDNGAFR
jgi:hypothetical protein